MDVVVTVPKGMWDEWIDEGDLPGDLPGEYESHFWFTAISGGRPDIAKGDRVYIVAHGKLRGYAPLIRIEGVCRLNGNRSCFVRNGGAEAVTIDEPIRGFQGWRYRWWERDEEHPFPDWQKA